MLFPHSLRLRLIALILTPLLIVAIAALSWQHNQARQSANEIFDQKLSIIALAIYRDLLATDGEQLSPATKLLFEEASGAPFFYHVSGPDGSFVTGYSQPPIRPRDINLPSQELVFFESIHRNKSVKVVQLLERTELDQLTGDVVVSVWQDLAQRQEFVQWLLLRGIIIAALLLITTISVVFFGIRRGLLPLQSLEQAIQQRSALDLSPIKRQVPREVSQIVRRLNTLFAEVTRSQSDRDRFISNAAHQLRNPIASIHSLAEVTQSSPSLKDARERNGKLLTASAQLVRLTEQLLSYESLNHANIVLQPLSIDTVITDVATKYASAVIEANLEFAFDPGCKDIIVEGDPLLIEQAVANLIDNAIKHGGTPLTHITIRTLQFAGEAEIHVCNNGVQIKESHSNRIFDRFEQGEEAVGSGLGLAIVQEICALHKGGVRLARHGDWTHFIIGLPILRSP